jgi:DNA helicase-2/ATP-dependent DNA helicase PcrA
LGGAKPDESAQRWSAAVMTLRIHELWERAAFKPNPQQREAILHTDGPLFLTAGPGSGKTRVLLWRTLNLIVFHDVPPEEIFLGTFTEKAALQLRDGLTAYLTDATRLTGRAYDLSRMPVGTVHSICRRILSDRRFSRGRMRPANVRLLDELDQYFAVLDRWNDFLKTGGFERNGNTAINQYLNASNSQSRHGAVGATVALFNRFSEECLDPVAAVRATRNPVLRKLLGMYGAYRALKLTDLSLLQQAALDHCRASTESGHVLRHVIVDEYQDTNHVQEAMFFHLARGHGNLCVVGDDDQALYRFRGSTVENLVEFEQRCCDKLGRAPRPINLGTNYRSRRAIVTFYSNFIQQFDWRKETGKKGSYRVESKKIVAHSKDNSPAVVASAPGHPDAVCAEVAALVRRLLNERKVSDPNQIAFLYPSLKSKQVQRMIRALEDKHLEVYAPRAGQFLDVPEALDVFGVFLVLFGRPDGGAASPGMEAFFAWVAKAYDKGKAVVRADRAMATFIKRKQQEVERAMADRRLFVAAIGEANLEKNLTESMTARIVAVRGVSSRATGYLRRGLRRLIESRRRTRRPLTAGYVVNRVTTLDWGVLDVFYELMGFAHFRRAFDLAQDGGDEGPVCNLALITRYMARFQAQRGAVLSARFLDEGRFVRTLFNSFLYALWRRGESEYEDAEDPFPKGRIPFLTVHQAKGLEFPIVVLGNPRKKESVQKIEEIVRPLLRRRQGEPLDRIAEFDVARMFYVALSRPQNLLVLCHYRGRGQHVNEAFETLLDDDFPRIADLDLDDVAAARPQHEEDLPRAYSYTGDYLAYRACPRRYMTYRRYDFAPARAQTMFFGNLVHRTIEDLHEWLRVQTEAGRTVS